MTICLCPAVRQLAWLFGTSDLHIVPNQIRLKKISESKYWNKQAAVKYRHFPGFNFPEKASEFFRSTYPAATPAVQTYTVVKEI